MCLSPFVATNVNDSPEKLDNNDDVSKVQILQQSVGFQPFPESFLSPPKHFLEYPTENIWELQLVLRDGKYHRSVYFYPEIIKRNDRIRIAINKQKAVIM